jgi:hypothetical protein
MAKGKHSIYGPELSDHEDEGRRIAESGLKCMMGNQSTSEAAKSDGEDVSFSELNKFKPSNP